MSTENSQPDDKKDSSKVQADSESSLVKHASYTNWMLTVIAICLSISTYKSFTPTEVTGFVDAYIQNWPSTSQGSSGTQSVRVTNWPSTQEVEIKQASYDSLNVTVDGQR